jgi:hypothetical protein
MTQKANTYPNLKPIFVQIILFRINLEWELSYHEQRRSKQSVLFDIKGHIFWEAKFDSFEAVIVFSIVNLVLGGTAMLHVCFITQLF